MYQSSTALVTTPRKSISTSISNLTSPSTPTPESFPPSPGSFRHPRLTEIIARQSASSLTNRNIQVAVVNLAALALSFTLNSLLHDVLTYIVSTIPVESIPLLIDLPLWMLRLYLLANVVLSLRPAIPYISKHDEIMDIPLTPSQRALLGLNPSASSDSVNVSGKATGFVTPPRYRRNSGTNTGTPSSQQPSDRHSITGNYSSSPLSTSRYTVGFSPSPQQSQFSQSYRRASGSPFSTSKLASTIGGSPLLHKTVVQNNNALLDFDASLNRSTSNLGPNTAKSTGLERSQSLRERDSHRRGSAPSDSIGPGPETPSPTGGRRTVATPGINYKWLYDKGSRLPKSESMGF